VLALYLKYLRRHTSAVKGKKARAIAIIWSPWQNICVGERDLHWESV
jgi:hypothetical protein